jgi:alcohol dehydrogenase class IV
VASSSLEENLSVLRINEFQNPQKMIFGANAVCKVGEEAERLGGGKILFVSDQNIEKAGLLGKVLKPLEEKKLDTKIYKIPTAEPTINSARAIAEEVRQKKYNTVIGIGGGSCLDSAKIEEYFT